MSLRKKICIADNHTIVREGLKGLLGNNPDFEVVAEVEDGIALMRVLQKVPMDLILLDLSMPKLNGLEAIPEIKKRCSKTKICMLTMHNTEEFVYAALAAGADGYVLKDATFAELEVAVRSVLAGKIYLSPSIANSVVRGFLDSRRGTRSQTPFDTLTLRERELLKLIAEGFKNRQIATALHISVKTVETHRANLMKKLDLHSSSELTSYAFERGLVEKI